MYTFCEQIIFKHALIFAHSGIAECIASNSTACLKCAHIILHLRMLTFCEQYLYTHAHISCIYQPYISRLYSYMHNTYIHARIIF